VTGLQRVVLLQSERIDPAKQIELALGGSQPLLLQLAYVRRELGYLILAGGRSALLLSQHRDRLVRAVFGQQIRSVQTELSQDSLLERLNELDDQAVAALEQGDEAELDARLDEMADLVQSKGEPLPENDLAASDIVIPPSDLTLEETRRLLSEDGLIPDLPAAT
jgi:hypothetical protein